MKHKHHIIWTAASWAALLALMLLTNPQNLPVILLIVPFVLLFVALMNLWRLVQRSYGRFASKQAPHKPNKRLGLTVCASLVLLLVLQSLDQLTLRDVATVTAIAIIGYIYVGRSRFAVKTPGH